MLFTIKFTLIIVVVFVQLVSATENYFEISQQQVTNVYNAFQFDNDIDSCSKFIDALLKHSGWQEPSDEWRDAAIKLIKGVVLRVDLNGGLSIPANAKLLHCYTYLEEQNKLLDSIIKETQPLVDVTSQVQSVRPSQSDTIASTSKRPNTFSEAQRRELDLAFSENPKPTRETMYMLASKLSTKYPLVVKWFSNKRRYYRPQTAEQQAPRQKKKPRKKIFIPRKSRLALIKAYLKDAYLTRETVQMLAQQLDLQDWEIKRWFKNRRKYFKKHNVQQPSADQPPLVRRGAKKNLLSDLAYLEFESVYLENPRPSNELIDELAAKHNLGRLIVWTWFRNRRTAQRIQNQRQNVDKPSK